MTRVCCEFFHPNVRKRPETWKHPILLKHTFFEGRVFQIAVVFHLNLTWLTCQHSSECWIASNFTQHRNKHCFSKVSGASNPAPLSAVFCLFGGNEVAETDETGSLRQCVFFPGCTYSCRGLYYITWKDRFLQRTCRFANVSCWVLFR